MIDAGKIAEIVLQTAQVMHEIRRPKFLPTKAELQHIVESVFWASIDVYEGTCLNPRILFAPPIDGHSTLRLDSPIVFTKDTIRSLCPAQSDNGGLIVSGGTSGCLEVHSLLCSSPSTRGSMPWWLMVESRKPGCVSVCFSSTPVVQFVLGSTTALAGMSHDKYSAMSMLLGAGIFNETSKHQLQAASLLLDISFAIEKKGEGGAIWILPSDSKMEGDLKGLGHIVQHNMSLLDPYRRMWDMDTGTIRILNQKTGIDQEWLRKNYWIQNATQAWDHLQQDAALNTISSLSGVDGAILFNGTPQLLSFGVVCNSFSSPLKAILRSNNPSRPMEGDEVDPSSFGGSRHRSAINFCASHNNAAAIVASHDGGITVFATKSPGTVIGSRVSAIESHSEPEATEN